MSLESPEINAIWGEVETIEGELFMLSGDTKSAFKSCRKALELLPIRASHARSYALGTQVVCYQMTNDLKSIKNIAIEFPPDSNLSFIRMQLWYSIAYAMEGDPMMMKKSASELIKLGEKHMHSESVVFGKYFLSAAHYLSNEDELAIPYLETVVKDPYVARPFYLVHCAFLLSVIYIEKGEVEKADQLMECIIRHLEEMDEIVGIAHAKAMKVELALKERNIDKALSLNKHLDSYSLYPPMWFVYVTELTLVKLKLAINTAKSVSEALQLLTEFEKPLRQTNKKALLIDVLILQALALKGQEKEKDALLKLEEALSFSNVGNCIRTYVDYGIELKDLLAGLSETHEHKAHIRNILEAISVKENKLFEVTKTEQSRKSVYFSIDDTSERLSIRELEVINLVAKGLRNKEIAELLFVQTDTIKQHLKNSFAKLKVPNRLMAVSRAEELNLINKA